MFRPFRISRSRNVLTIAMRRPPITGAVLLTLLSLPLFAHDMWIEPTTFSPKPGQIVGVRLRVGQDLLGDPIPRDPALVNQFIVEDAEGRKPVIGRDGRIPPEWCASRGPVCW